MVLYAMYNYRKKKKNPTDTSLFVTISIIGEERKKKIILYLMVLRIRKINRIHMIHIPLYYKSRFSIIS